ncbi:MAG: hypothetical protein INR66_26360 [Gordonia polyisoprenivorans]|nr:hypothetical protein [Gordonia polyisoprenivorans]
MPDFEVFDKANVLAKHVPMVTLLKGRILSLNRAAFVALEQPKAVELLFDRVKRIIGLRPVLPSIPHACFVRTSGRGHNGPFLVSAMAFVRYYEIDTTESLRWEAWLEDETLCVPLDADAQLVANPRAPQAGHP